MTGAIDVHNHALPRFLIERLEQHGPLPLALQRPEARAWTPGRAVEELDRNDVATAVLSAVPLHESLVRMSRPDVAALARDLNEYVAERRRDVGNRFGLFTTLPMPDVERSLAEIEYALDVLGAEGVGLFTRYGAQTIADPAFHPVLEELDRRAAVVFCHPDTSACCAAEDGALAHPYDTGRAVFQLLLGGTLARFPSIRWIFCHGGGTVPVLSGRVAEMAKASPRAHEIMPRGIAHELGKLHYETGNAATAPAMAALLSCVPVSQVLFGTDAPYFGIDANLAHLRANRLSEPVLAAIEHGNARRLFPRLTTAEAQPAGGAGHGV